MGPDLTTGDISELFGVANWQARRVIDALGLGGRRIGQYRIVARHELGRIAAELERRGWLPKPETAEATSDV